MSNPVFSIITPTCKRPLLLQRNIRSVRQQSFTDYEHIIIDDACDMETESIIAGFQDPRIVFLRHETTRGASASYNTGIKAARGEFILFLDDDDEYLPSFLEKMHARFSAADTAVGFIWSGISRIKDTGRGEEFLFSLTWPQKFATKEEGLVAATSIGNGFGLCVRRQCIDDIGLYDESLIVCEDTDLLFRLARKFDCETIPESLVKLHQHDSAQLTSDQNHLVRVEGKEKVLGRYDDFMLRYPAVYYTQYKAFAGICYKHGLKQKGRKIMVDIIKNTAFRFLNYTDSIFFELTGKDTATLYAASPARKLVRFLKGKPARQP